ncbi:hypothetical protein G9A89_016462 [Geosiphon pyriformis]|nr:hypothetical protein G9A89_016462 [Geosiphon pyriformis]
MTSTSSSLSVSKEAWDCLMTTLAKNNGFLKFKHAFRKFLRTKNLKKPDIFQYFSNALADISTNNVLILAFCHLYATGTPQSSKQAFDLFVYAMYRGNPVGTFCVAECYARGIGISKELESLAFERFEEAAKKGFAPAQLALGNCFSKGMGTEKNFSKADYWYNEAAKQGNSEARFQLGFSYTQGRAYCKKNCKVALRLYENAAIGGNKYAPAMLAIFCRQGMGTMSDLHQAIYWHRKTSNKLDSITKRHLHSIFKGKGSKK